MRLVRFGRKVLSRQDGRSVERLTRIAGGGGGSRYLCAGRSVGSDSGEKVWVEPLNHANIARKWQDRWRQAGVAKQGGDATLPSKYVLCMFPYPSGNLHMGHVRVYAIGDAIARTYRLMGNHVLFPMGWDAFGLPAENAAIERGIDPGEWTISNIKTMKKQLDSLGLAVDWDQELATCDPTYYKWTQWLFIQLFKSGLAYQDLAVVNWDPVDKTVLANEQVDKEGRSWRSGALVEQRELRQWFLGITKYADKLLDGLEHVNWPRSVCTQQHQWIGKSEGVSLTFGASKENGDKVSVFTTRPETVFGVTFVALAPSHPLSHQLAEKHGLMDELSKLKRKKDEEHLLFLHDHVKHPLTGEMVPLYAATYVLDSYGEGAVMGVPAHDERDQRLAKTVGLEVRTVIDPDSNKLIHSSSSFDGLDATTEGRAKIIDAIVQSGNGERKLTYRLRDWLVSRQRLWGTPIPIIHCPDCGPVPVPEKDLPFLQRRPDEDVSSWASTTCPGCNNPDAKKETDTLDTFVDSAWYFLRFCDNKNPEKPFSAEAVNKWMKPNGVDLYIGGIEHAILHLLYARFVNQYLHEQGYSPVSEPFHELLAQGMVLGQTAKVAGTGQYLKPEEWKFDEEKNPIVTVPLEDVNSKIDIVWEKMSKSKYNGVNPDAVVEKFGADVARLTVLFAAPPEDNLEWDEAQLYGQSRFLNRIWEGVVRHKNTKDNKVEENTQHSKELTRVTHASIVATTHYIVGSHGLNSAIAELMKLSNAINKCSEASWEARAFAIRSLVIMLSPFAPHVAEEFWETLHDATEGSVHDQQWPKGDPKLAQDNQRLVVVGQLSGKKKTVLEIDLEMNQEGNPIIPTNDELVTKVKEQLGPQLSSLTIRREIVVLPKTTTHLQAIVNIVAN